MIIYKVIEIFKNGVLITPRSSSLEVKMDKEQWEKSQQHTRIRKNRLE